MTHTVLHFNTIITYEKLPAITNETNYRYDVIVTHAY